MAYPDYSIVIICVTEGGVTTDYAKSFFTKALAEKYYRKAVSEGKRAFLYEKPVPTKFTRNDAQKIAVNTEKAAFALAVTTPSSGDTSGTTATVKEAVHKFASFQIETAFLILETIQTANFKIGEKVYTVYDNAFNKFRQFVGWEYTPINTVAATLTITNKRIVIKHNGSGGFLAPVITKLWPNKDEAIDDQPVPVQINLQDGPSVQIGLKTQRRTYDGTEFGQPEVQNFYLWVPSGTTLHETETLLYKSDGDGWYIIETKPVDPENPPPPPPPNPNCPAAGTVLGVGISNPVYCTFTDAQGYSQYAIVGSEIYPTIADGNCDSNLGTKYNEYLPHGTVVMEDEGYFYKSDNLGGVFQMAKPPVEPPVEPPPPPCPPAGSIISTERTPDPAIQGNDTEAGDFEYVGVFKVRNTIADGGCGYSIGPETTEYQDANVFIKETVREDLGFVYTILTDVNGGWKREVSEIPTDCASTGNCPPDVDNPNMQTGNQQQATIPDYPNTDDTCSEGPLDSYKRNENGLFVGTRLAGKRRIAVPLNGPATGWSRSASESGTYTMMFTTGYQWKNRKISNGPSAVGEPCKGWRDEDNDAPSCYGLPLGEVAFPAGRAMASLSGGTGGEEIQMFYKVRAGTTSLSLDRYESKRFYARHNGLGGITWHAI